jgi:ferredoxin-thioredoxin reductase catalytic subunit
MRRDKTGKSGYGLLPDKDLVRKEISEAFVSNRESYQLSH